MQHDRLEKLRQAIAERMHRQHGLTVSLEKMLYAEAAFLGRVRDRKRALFVGVGHGHDAIVSLLRDRVAVVDGVDPYYGAQGNDNRDYEDLVALVATLSLEGRFNVHRQRIEEFLSGHDAMYDLIVLPDVLHHIFVTQTPLRRSSLFEDAVQLFADLRAKALPECVLAISDAPRAGLRPTLAKHGVLRGRVNYRTKHASGDWQRAAERAGWRRVGGAAYVPYALRKFRRPLQVPPLPWFYANRYFLWLTT